MIAAALTWGDNLFLAGHRDNISIKALSLVAKLARAR